MKKIAVKRKCAPKKNEPKKKDSTVGLIDIDGDLASAAVPTVNLKKGPGRPRGAKNVPVPTTRTTRARQVVPSKKVQENQELEKEKELANDDKIERAGARGAKKEWMENFEKRVHAAGSRGTCVSGIPLAVTWLIDHRLAIRR